MKLIALLSLLGAVTGISELNSHYAYQNTKYQTYNDVLTLSEEKDILNTEEVNVPSDINVHLEAPFKVVLDKN